MGRVVVFRKETGVLWRGVGREDENRDDGMERHVGCHGGE
jgi:hypothetical protein